MKGGLNLEPSNLFEIIDDLSNHSIQLLCHLAKLSRSGYYNWVKRKAFPSKRRIEDEKLKQKIIECHQKYKGIYGYRRIKIWLKRTYDIHINHKKVQRLLSELALKQLSNLLRKERTLTYFE
ncbi:IS3 family transposase (plasmid) [Cytobacillus solani]|uniref:IS3 family transposase n=1 Tax=Cytobacillus solani TaxID=1637975 RepID=UPI00207A47A5|nr:IS3 family transposase [Cytobacillus solani]USK57722.1 IS3 family transposase [Cytobacillus solani]